MWSNGVAINYGGSKMNRFILVIILCLVCSVGWCDDILEGAITSFLKWKEGMSYEEGMEVYRNCKNHGDKRKYYHRKLTEWEKENIGGNSIYYYTCANCRLLIGGVPSAYPPHDGECTIINCKAKRTEKIIKQKFNKNGSVKYVGSANNETN